MKNRCKDMTFMLYSITFTKKNHEINTNEPKTPKNAVFLEVYEPTGQQVYESTG